MLQGEAACRPCVHLHHSSQRSIQFADNEAVTKAETTESARNRSAAGDGAAGKNRHRMRLTGPRSWLAHELPLMTWTSHSDSPPAPTRRGFGLREGEFAKYRGQIARCQCKEKRHRAPV